MPIFELGYRHWEGALTPGWRRWTAISRAGISLAFRSKVLRRLLFLAWAPLLYFGPLFFAVGYVTDPARGRSEWSSIARAFLGPELAHQLANNPESFRPHVWSAIFSHFFMYSQSFLTFLVLAIVAPPLIAQDVRSKAFLLYFSKPITRVEYLFGKVGTTLFCVFLVTLLPAVVLYAVSIAFSPSIGVLADTFVTLPRILTASLVVALPASFLVLAFSSLTSDGRYATFAWIGVWLLGEMFFRILEQVPGLRGSGWLFFPSIREASAVVIGGIFDVESLVALAERVNAGRSQIRAMLHSPYSPAAGLAHLLCVAGLSLAVIYRRISAPMRV